VKIVDVSNLSGPTDWSGPTFTGISDAAVKFRWINSAFRWHRNDGPELFLVLDREVDMPVRAGPGGESQHDEDGVESHGHRFTEGRTGTGCGTRIRLTASDDCRRTSTSLSFSRSSNFGRAGRAP